MYVNYDDAQFWTYVCKKRNTGEVYTGKSCQIVNGCSVDEAVSNIMLQKLTPEAVKAADEVFRELEKRKHSEENYFVMQLEKAKYETDLARKRYMKADPENRLVSAELERIWNEKMLRLAQAETELGKYRSESNSGHIKTDMGRLLEFSEKLQKAWADSNLGIRDKKRIVRCFVEDIALNKTETEIQIGIRFKGGMTEFVTVPRKLKAYEKTVTDPAIVEYVAEASKKYTAGEIAEQLNSRNKRTGTGLQFTKLRVRDIQNRHKISSLTVYLHSLGYLSMKEKAKQLGMGRSTLVRKIKNGSFEGTYIKSSEIGDYMFEP